MAPPGNWASAPQAALVIGEEQVVAPGQGRGERAATLGSGRGGVGEQGEPVAETLGDLGHGQDPGPGGRELDRERQAVQRSTDLGHGRCGLGGERERRPALGGESREQPDGLRFGERRQRPRHLPVQPESPLAGRENAYPGGGVKHRDDELAHRLDQVLAVVEHEEQLGAAQPLDTVRPRHRPCERGGQLRGGRYSLQSHQPGPARCTAAAGDLDRQPGLAHAGRTDQRDEPVGVEVGQPGVKICGAADEWRGQRGEVPAVAFGGFRFEGPVVGEHLALQRPQLRAGVDAELVDEQCRDPPEGA